MPETFGRYELIEVLGRGGMGVVWRAHDTVRQRNVALKVLPEHLADDAQFTARFRRESRLAAQLNEPHIVPIHDFGEIEGRLFIDMRLVEGVDLGTVLEERNRLAPQLAVEILSQVASALDAAHADGLVHRDVKPGNVMLTGMTPDLRRTPFAYLVDFGIARSTQSAMTYATMTSAGAIGTVAYISPERIAGEPGDARSDVYALACMLFEVLTGALPFEGESLSVLYKHVNEAVPRAHDRVPDVPRALDDVITKGMAKAPADRYAQAGELMQAAHDALAAPLATTDRVRPAAEDHGGTRKLPVAPPPATPRPATPPPAGPLPPTPPPPAGIGSPFRPVPPPRRRRRGLIGAVAVVVVAALIVLGVVLLSGNTGRTNTARTPAGTATTGPGPARAVVGDIDPTPRADLEQGGTARLALTVAVKNFNVYTTDGATDEADRATAALLPQPFHYDATGVASVDPDYFTSITQTSSDPMTIRYTINPKARWSDGQALSYRDFAGLAAAMSGRNSDFDAATTLGWDRIASVTEGRDAQQVIVEFSTPFADWRRLFAPLVPARLTASASTFNTAWRGRPLITAGPFRYQSAAGAAPYVEPADPAWWGDKPKLSSLQFDLYDNQSAAVTALAAKKINYAVLGGINANANVAVVKKAGGLSVRQYDAGTTSRLLTFNTRDALLSDIAVRRAIVHATDRATMTTRLIGAQGGSPTPLQHYFALQRTPGYTSTCGSYCAYDVPAARTLLSADGWTRSGAYYAKNGQPLEVHLLVPRGAANATSEAALLQTSFKAAGINLIIDTESPATVAHRLSDGDFQLVVATRIATQFPVSDDVGYFHYNPSDRRENYGAGGSTKINALFSAALSATSTAAARTADDALSSAMWPNASWLPLYERPQVSGVTSTLANIGAGGLADTRYQDVGYRS